MVHTAYIGLGANLGDAAATLRIVLAELTSSTDITDCAASPLYRSAPVNAQGPDYVNAVARIATPLEPLPLLDLLQALEQRHGRERPYHHAPRTLDLDLLLFDDQIIKHPRLTVPHPRMHERAFVLAPLLDLVPDLRLSQGIGKALLAALGGQAIEPLAFTQRDRYGPIGY